MGLYAAFLRGINLGNRRVRNDELRSSFEAIDLAEVACFRASGNVVFAADDEDEAVLSKRIEAGLGESLGYEVSVFLRNAAELRKIVATEPFGAGQVAASKGKLQVVLLREPPKAAGRKRALSLGSDDDRLALEGRELYWLPRGGMSESDLDLKAIDAALGQNTIRTKGTVDQIAARHFSG